jgi:transposase
MARTRALLTEADRELIAERRDTDSNLRYQAISRVRGRIHEELPEDIELLREHHPELLAELREVVCDEE